MLQCHVNILHVWCGLCHYTQSQQTVCAVTAVYLVMTRLRPQSAGLVQLLVLRSTISVLFDQL